MSTFDLFIEAGENAKTALNDAICAACEGDGEKANTALAEALKQLTAMIEPLAPPNCRKEGL